MPGLTPLPIDAPRLTPLPAAGTGLTPLDAGLPVLNPSASPLDDWSAGTATVPSSFPVGSPFQPAYTPAPRPAPVRRRNTEGFGFVSVLSSTWNIFWPNWLGCSLATLIVIALSAAFSTAWQFVVAAIAALWQPPPDTPLPLYLLFTFAIAVVPMLIVTSALQGGLLRLVTLLAKGQPAGLGDFFAGFRFALSIFVAQFMVSLLLFLVPNLIGIVVSLILPSLPKVAAGVVMVAFLVATVVFYFYVSLSFLLAPCLIVDRDEGPFEALSESGSTMEGRRLVTLAVLFIVGVLLIPAIACTLGLGAILAVPYAAMLLAVIYLKATDQPTAG
jgi:hypothetical protein